MKNPKIYDQNYLIPGDQRAFDLAVDGELQERTKIRRDEFDDDKETTYNPYYLEPVNALSLRRLSDASIIMKTATAAGYGVGDTIRINNENQIFDPEAETDWAIAKLPYIRQLESFGLHGGSVHDNHRMLYKTLHIGEAAAKLKGLELFDEVRKTPDRGFIYGGFLLNVIDAISETHGKKFKAEIALGSIGTALSTFAALEFLDGEFDPVVSPSLLVSHIVAQRLGSIELRKSLETHYDYGHAAKAHDFYAALRQKSNTEEAATQT